MGANLDAFSAGIEDDDGLGAFLAHESAQLEAADAHAWMANEDWNEEGVEAWLSTWVDNHPDVLELTTPELSPGERKVVHACAEAKGLETKTVGFGLKRSILLVRR